MVPIVGPPSVHEIRVGAFLHKKEAHWKFKNRAATHLYKMSEALGVDPAVTIAQVCLETGYGHSELCIDYNNFAGVKVWKPDNAERIPEDFCQFRTVDVGLRAYLTHLTAYLGKWAAPVDVMAVYKERPIFIPEIDPRYDYINIQDKIKTVEGLTGSWATDPEYADKIKSILEDM